MSATQSPPVTLEIEDHIALVRFRNPPVNALTEAIYLQLTEIFQRLSYAPGNARAIVLTSEGTRAFSAGSDVKELGVKNLNDPTWQERHSALVRQTFSAVYHCRLPVIAAVQATAVGGGVVLAASCDLVVASDEALIALGEIEVGVLGGAAHLRRMMPQHAVRLMTYTGRRIRLAELYEYGSVAKVAKADQVVEEAKTIARQIAAKSPVAVQLAKEGLNHVEIHNLDAERGYFYEQSLTRQLAAHPDALHAAKSFLDHKKPTFE